MIARGIVAAVVLAAASAVAAPAGAGGGCHRVHEEGQTEASGTSVEMQGGCFGPTILSTAAGAEVTFVNRDTYAHNVTGTTWRSSQLDEGATFVHRFATPGTYPFSCTLHPGMTGAVVVSEPASAPPQEGREGRDDWPLAAIPVGLVGGFLVGRVAPARRRARAAAAP